MILAFHQALDHPALAGAELGLELGYEGLDDEALVLGVVGVLDEAVARSQKTIPVRQNLVDPTAGAVFDRMKTEREKLVKSYTAEQREEIVFTEGAHRLFRNVARSMTGVSATTAGSTVIVGIIGVLMIWLGGRSILAGQMTLGDLMMYIFFIGLVAAPLVSIASIGTQITEAFAGLDRIREILSTTTELDEDARRQPVARLDGRVEFEQVWFEYHPGRSVRFSWSRNSSVRQ